jgi:hypothetical protein
MKRTKYSVGCVYTNLIMGFRVWVADDLRRHGLAKDKAKESPNIDEAWDLGRQLAAQAMEEIFKNNKDFVRLVFPGNDDVPSFAYTARLVPDAEIYGDTFALLVLRLSDGSDSEMKQEDLKFHACAGFGEEPRVASHH